MHYSYYTDRLCEWVAVKKKYFGRVTKQLSAIVSNPDGLRVKVVAIDTAVDGVSILCNFYQRDLLTPRGSFIRNGRPVELSLSLDLPDEKGGLSPLVARCHISYSRRISKEKCVIGMRYIGFENDSEDRLFQFLSNTSAFGEGASSSPVCA
jgi:hypothetical protein